METKYNGKPKKKVLIKNSDIFLIVEGELEDCYQANQWIKKQFWGVLRPEA